MGPGRGWVGRGDGDKLAVMGDAAVVIRTSRSWSAWSLSWIRRCRAMVAVASGAGYMTILLERNP
jgi:hypothetical protein